MSSRRLRKILIVDNDEEVLLAFERVLEDEGYTAATAASHKETVGMLSQGCFDLLVLDDDLSGKNSIELLTELQTSGIKPLVIVTYHHDVPLDQKRQLSSFGGLRAGEQTC